MMGDEINKLATTSAKAAVNALIDECFSKKIRDIHIEPETNKHIIRVRVGKNLKNFATISNESATKIASYLKEASSLIQLGSRMPQNGNFKRKSLTVEFSSIPVIGGEKLFLHLTDQRTVTKDFEKLGFSKSDADKVRNLSELNSGLVLVLGEGKTTTMFSILSLFDSQRLNISTIESRHTYRLPHINQFIIEDDFLNQSTQAVTAAIKQRSNVIMLSQIDQHKTAELCIDAALNNRVVITSLPTSDPFTAIEFLLGLGVKPFLVAHAIKMIVCQELVQKDGLTGKFSVLEVNDKLQELIKLGISASEIKKLYEASK